MNSHFFNSKIKICLFLAGLCSTTLFGCGKEEVGFNNKEFDISKNNDNSLKVVINHKTDYVKNPTEKMLASKIEKGDLLMCLSSQSDNPEPLGKTAIYPFDFPALLNQRVLKMKAYNQNMIKFLYYMINSHYFHYTVSHQGGGSAQANLKLEHVLGMLIPIPPLVVYVPLEYLTVQFLQQVFLLKVLPV